MRDVHSEPGGIHDEAIGAFSASCTFQENSMLKIMIAAAAILVLATSAPARSADLSKTVDGVTFYVGVIPAEIVRGHPAEHSESTMHGSVPAGSRHIVVALFDAETGERITDAQVSARVEQLGLSAEHKDLDPMQIAGTVSYGNFYAMPGGEIFKIRVIVKRKGGSRRIEAEFEYRG